MTESFFDSPSIAFYSGRMMEQNPVWIMHPWMLYIQKVSLPGLFNTWHIYISHTPQRWLCFTSWNSYWFWLDTSVHFFFAFSTSFHTSGMPKNFGYFGHSFLRGVCSLKGRSIINKGRSLLQGRKRKFIVLPASEQSPFWAIFSQKTLWKKNCRNARQKVSKHYSFFLFC